MTDDKLDKKVWLELIDKCLQQDNYGHMDGCVFCDYVERHDYSARLPLCKPCICSRYFEELGLNWDDYVGTYPCTAIMRSLYDPEGEGIMPSFYAPNVRDALRNMRIWLDKS